MLPNTRAVWLATVVQCVTGGLGVTLIPQTAAAVETTRSRLELARFVAPARRDESVWCLALLAAARSPTSVLPGLSAS
ncbi:Conserved protein of uncharacterised function%2C possible fragment of LysR/OxyR-like transcriptional regulator [Mycobacterium tuberculosis]|nr:Conserved protein of uncharacterised function%2C possible fragment of LysR/OxyR-like transcriptional regulator [Mycobacterium tuberculosis]